MNKVILLFSHLILFLFGFYKSHATHVAGMDVQWKCLGNDTYQITLVVYRRCTDGASSMSTLPPVISSDSCGNSYTISTPSAQSYTIDDITPVCGSQQKPCPLSGGNAQSSSQVPLGLERHTWVYKIFLGGNYSNCCWYKIHWQLCCRSSIITTGLADADFYDDFWLNRCMANNSPKFSSNVLLIKNAGEDIRYNLGMVDDENDSLTYRLSPPLGGAYSSPWSFNYPLTCFNGNNPNPNLNPPTGFNLDPLTGDLIFHPTQVQSSVIKITVTEWRKIGGIAKVIGVTSRDLQVFILQGMNNKLPTLSGPYIYNFCAGSESCFTINTNDQNIADTTRILTNNSIALSSSTFSKSPDTTKQAYGQFCWNPGTNDIRSRPYYFVAGASDNSCPVTGEAYRSYTIYVRPQFSVNTLIEKLSCSTYNFKAINTDTSSHYRQWQIYKGSVLVDSFLNSDSIAGYKFKSTGKFYIKYHATNAYCDAIKWDTIIITNATSLDLLLSQDSVICKGDSFFLDVTPLNGISPYAYRWYLNGILVNSTSGFTVRPVTNSMYRVEVISSDSCKMSQTGTVNIVVDSSTTRLAKINDTLICIGSSIDILPLVISGRKPYLFHWYQNGVMISSSSILSIIPKKPSSYILELVSADRCNNTAMDTFNIGFFPSGLVSITTTGTNIFKGQSLSMKANGKGNFNWIGSNIISSWNDSILVRPLVSTTYTLICKNYYECDDTAQITIYVNNVGLKSPVKLNEMKFSVYPNPAKNELVVSYLFAANNLFTISNMLGQYIMQGDIKDEKMILNIASLKAGIYFIKIGEEVRKFVKD